MAPGGKRKGAGRKSAKTHEIERIAGDLARKYIEENLKPVLDTYLALAAGQWVKQGKKKFKHLVDPATTRDAVGKFVADAAKTVDLNLTGADAFFRAIQESRE